MIQGLFRSLFLFLLRWRQNPFVYDIFILQIFFNLKNNVCTIIWYFWKIFLKEKKKKNTNLLSPTPKGTPSGLWNVPVRFHLTQGHHFRLPQRKLPWWKSVLPNFPGKRTIALQVHDCNMMDKNVFPDPQN